MSTRVYGVFAGQNLEKNLRKNSIIFRFCNNHTFGVSGFLRPAGQKESPEKSSAPAGIKKAVESVAKWLQNGNNLCYNKTLLEIRR